MGFFDAARVPPPPPPPSYRLPAWLAPPQNVAPARVYVDVELARSDAVMLEIVVLRVYPVGVSFTVRGRGDVRGTHPLFGGPPLVDGGLALGVLFADGRPAIATHALPRPALQEPQEPVLRIVSGSGGGADRFDTDLWLWPLPPAGPFAFVVEWLAAGIAQTRATIDAAEVQAAAQRAEELWRDDRDLPPTEGDILI